MRRWRISKQSAMNAGSDRVSIDCLEPREVMRLRDIRLRALRDAPTAFGSSYEVEAARDEAEWRRRAEAWADRDQGVILLARLGGDDVGVAAGFRDGDGRCLAWLVSMWVAPEARRSGVGRALVGEIAAWAESIRVDALRLHVTSGNDSARRLYEAAGFVATGDWMQHPRYADLVEHEMERPLTAAAGHAGP